MITWKKSGPQKWTKTENKGPIFFSGALHQQRIQPQDTAHMPRDFVNQCSFLQLDKAGGRATDLASQHLGSTIPTTESHSKNKNQWTPTVVRMRKPTVPMEP